MIRVDEENKVSWWDGFTLVDLLKQFNESRALVGAIINGRYISRSHFSRTKIPDGAEVRLIPWKEGMTLAELLNYEIDEDYFYAATVDRRFVPEIDFGETVIPKDSEVWLLPPVGGG